MNKKRNAGVLLNISSLPGPFGIGVFGEEAFNFIDFLKELGFTYWQILPLGNLDYGNSPYCSDSSLAGNFLYVDPRKLCRDGYITKDDADACIYSGSPYTADFNFARETRVKVLTKALEKAPDMSDFIKDNAWVKKYAEYSSKKSGLSERYYVFEQFIFFKQWFEVKEYANKNGIKIIGDMPLYVAGDSVDVWAYPEFFKKDEVAGVPPDYFSEEGQLWGNPLYDWEAMEKDGYSWWKMRIENSLKLYDVLRFDHFRGLASYWSIPKGAKSAKEGHWEEGPGMKLFKALGYKNPADYFIAEDLGVFGDDVVELLKKTGLPGMRVIQFAFDGSYDSVHLPHKYSENTIAYTGTHDNNTLLGWLWEQTPEEREFCLDYVGYHDSNWGDGGYQSRSCRAVIEAVWKSSAKTAIIAFQDMCGFGRDARMNIPGVPELNWRFRTTQDTINSVDKNYFKKINKIFGR